MTLTLRAVLEPRGPAGAIVLDPEQVAALGGGAKTFAVRVTVKGRTVPLRLARMGGESLIGFARAVREQLGVELGETLDVEIARDDAPREVALPAELDTSLTAEPELRAAWDALAPSRRKELARSIVDAKRPETRARRLDQTLAALRGT